MIQTSLLKRGPGLAFGVALFALTPAVASAETTGWSATTQNITTGVNLGYEAAIDTYNNKVYAADAQGIRVERQFQWTGTPATLSTTEYTDTVIQAATGKVVSIDIPTLSFAKSWNHTGLKDTNGNPSTGIIPAVTTPTPAPASWAFNIGQPNAQTGIATGNNTQLGQLPYGVVVDGNLADPTIVTANTRTASVTVYKASQAAPTDADVIKYATVGYTGVQARTPVVDPVRHKAYVAGYNGANGVVFQINTISRQVEAVIPAPGVVGLAIDLQNNRLFAGTYQAAATAESPKGHFLRILDLNKVNTSNPADKSLNAGVEVKAVPNVGENTRPGYDEKTQKVYLANSVATANPANNAAPQVTVVDANPSSATYGTVVKTIPTPARPNAVTVDAERGLAYVPLLGGRSLLVIDTKTDTVATGVPTTGNAVDADVDPKTGVVFVTNQGTGSTAGTAQLQAIKVSRPAELPKGDTGAAGATGPAGAPGAAGAPGKDGLQALSLQLSSLKLLGSKLSFKAPSAGVLTVSVKTGKRTIATGKRTATKAGSYSLTLKKTKYGKSKLAQKKSLKGTLTATFTPSTGGAKTQTAIKATIKR